MARDLRSSNVQDLETLTGATGAERIPAELNGRDVQLTAQQIADLGPTPVGQGLPSEWTVLEDGAVIAQVDVSTRTPLTVRTFLGQTSSTFTVQDENGRDALTVSASAGLSENTVVVQGAADQDIPVFIVRDPNGADVVAAEANATKTQLSVQVAESQDAADRVIRLLDTLGNEFWWVNWEPDGRGATVQFAMDSSATARNTLDFDTGVFAESAYLSGTVGNLSAIQLDVYADLVDPTQSVAHVVLTAFVSQTQPVYDQKNSSGTTVLSSTPTGAIDMLEQSAPAAPAANTARLYTRDTGGKTQLVVQFPTGAVQVIATEP